MILATHTEGSNIYRRLPLSAIITITGHIIQKYHASTPFKSIVGLKFEISIFGKSDYMYVGFSPFVYLSFPFVRSVEKK